jgi:hypothetical protein
MCRAQLSGQLDHERSEHRVSTHRDAAEKFRKDILNIGLEIENGRGETKIDHGDLDQSRSPRRFRTIARSARRLRLFMSKEFVLDRVLKSHSPGWVQSQTLLQQI